MAEIRTPDFGLYPDLYAELEVAPKATVAVIEASYQRLIRRAHLGLGLDGPDPLGRVQRLKLARAVLSNQVDRYRYDVAAAARHGIRASQVRPAGPWRDATRATAHTGRLRLLAAVAFMVVMVVCVAGLSSLMSKVPSGAISSRNSFPPSSGLPRLPRPIRAAVVGGGGVSVPVPLQFDAAAGPRTAEILMTGTSSDRASVGLDADACRVTAAALPGGPEAISVNVTALGLVGPRSWTIQVANVPGHGTVIRIVLRQSQPTEQSFEWDSMRDPGTVLQDGHRRVTIDLEKDGLHVVGDINCANS